MGAKNDAKKRAKLIEEQKERAERNKKANQPQKGIPVSPGNGQQRQKNKKPTGQKKGDSKSRYRW